MPVLAITRLLPKDVLERAAKSYSLRANPQDETWSPEEILRQAEGADAVVTSPGGPLPAAVIERLPDSVKMIATFSVGYEHVDVAAAKKRGIVVTNTPDVLTDATADIALLCLLGAARRAWEAMQVLHAGEWEGWAPNSFMGTHLGGKRLGIDGMGRIGRAVATRARAFGMEIHYHNRNRLDPALEEGATYYADADELMKVSDFFSINAPSSPDTESFLDARRIELMPQGAIVVNTARGTLVDDEALIAALKSGRLAGAGLDVYRNEPKLHAGYLGLTNAFLLPHLGSGTVETRNAMGFCCLDNLDAFFAGKEPPNRLV